MSPTNEACPLQTARLNNHREPLSQALVAASNSYQNTGDLDTGDNASRMNEMALGRACAAVRFNNNVNVKRCYSPISPALSNELSNP